MASPGVKSYPSAAFILTLIGGILIFLSGLVTAATYAILGSLAISILPGLGVLLIGLAVVALLFGIIIMVGGLRMRSDPGSARTWGIIVIVLSLLSLIGGGGFFLGLILGLVGGILAIVWHPPAVAQPAWGQPQAPGAPMSSSPPASGGKTCPSCGTSNAAGTQFCAKCGAALPA